ncbi:flagellar biosynthesis protein FlhB [Sporichthya brevicatena]|uniref:Flagellar biosynthesis protein FlhB n=1 Tax=Sporichthya brevicatena TaxID=171442 RepID=A0ABN1GDV8_9ACTN
MSGGSDGDKTEKPTPKKLREARKEGQIPRSQDIGAWAGVLAACYLLQFTIHLASPRLRALFHRISQLIAEPTEEAALALFVDGFRDIAIILAPLMLGLAVVTFAASAAQGGIHLATKHAKPKFKRMNPIQGFKRIAGPQAGWEATKTVLKTTIAALIAYRAVKGTSVLLTSGGMSLSAQLDVVSGTMFGLMRDVAIAGLLMGVADYGYQRRRVGKQLKMSMHEVKQEHKQTEGDPHLKGAIRSKQMAMSRNRMMSKIAQADVVLVNPTHVAVALQYVPDRGAPRVVAKGAGHVATRIREEATKHRVAMVSDVPLARALYKACDLDQEIPGEMFAAVAAVLAFVLSLKARGSAVGTHKLPQLLGR